MQILAMDAMLFEQEHADDLDGTPPPRVPSFSRQRTLSAAEKFHESLRDVHQVCSVFRNTKRGLERERERERERV